MLHPGGGGPVAAHPPHPGQGQHAPRAAARDPRVQHVQSGAVRQRAAAERRLRVPHVGSQGGGPHDSQYPCSRAPGRARGRVRQDRSRGLQRSFAGRAAGP